jgi:hypothetical protein
VGALPFDGVFRVFVWVAFANACYSISVCFAATLLWAADGALFRPVQKWAPLSFNKLMHESWRFATPNMLKSLKDVDFAVPMTLGLFLHEIETFFVVFDNHAEQEDKIIYPAVGAVFPGVNDEGEAEHIELEAILLDVKAAAVLLRTAVTASSFGPDALAALESMRAKLPQFFDLLLPHLRKEELGYAAVMRKYLSIERHKEIVGACFDVTSTKDW